MTNEEMRKHPGYIEALEKIKHYTPGFKFTIQWDPIPKAKANGLRFILRDACELGLIESISDDWGWNSTGDFTMTASTYKRTVVQV